MDYISIILLIFLVIDFIWFVVSWVKSDNTCKQRAIIFGAIHKYQLWCVHNHVRCLVNYDDMETYDATDRRWKDWGYTNILTKEKFELIKPFIEEEKK